MLSFIQSLPCYTFVLLLEADRLSHFLLTISIMSQYTPISLQLGDHPELNRRITRREYDRVVDYAVSIGVTNAYIQERDVAVESFIPQWDIK